MNAETILKALADDPETADKLRVVLCNEDWVMVQAASGLADPRLAARMVARLSPDAVLRLKHAAESELFRRYQADIL